MVAYDTATPQGPSLAPDGIFVIHVRSDSVAARQHQVRRVEHLKSGDSEQLASLPTLLGSIDRARRTGGGGRSAAIAELSAC
jgi:hypothetical protein